MPHFTASFGRSGPLTPVLLGPVHTALRHFTQADLPRSIRASALVDTGASETCVDAGLIRDLRLPVSGKARLQTSSTGQTPTLTSNYDISLLVPHPAGADAALTLPELRVTAVDLARQPFQVLLGRDVLRHCILAYNGTQGWLTLAW